MSVVPKRIYSDKKHGDIPVWEITTHKGQKIYYEREHRPGYLAIGVQETYRIGKSKIYTVDVVKKIGHQVPTVLRIRDGYIAENSWYEEDPDFEGIHAEYPEPEISHEIEENAYSDSE